MTVEYIAFAAVAYAIVLLWIMIELKTDLKHQKEETKRLTKQLSAYEDSLKQCKEARALDIKLKKDTPDWVKIISEEKG